MDEQKQKLYHSKRPATTSCFSIVVLRNFWVISSRNSAVGLKD